jgi:hypothetical protein
MALVPCPKCGKGVSSTADACPKCGYELTRPTAGKQWIVIVLIAVLGLLVLFYLVNRGQEERSNSEQAAIASCDVPKADSFVKELLRNEVFQKLEADRSVPRIYVSDAWYQLTIDEKKTLDGILQCHFTRDSRVQKLAVYHDSRSGKEIAETGPGGFVMK